MKIQNISLNLFKTKNTAAENKINANPFAVNASNPFAGGLTNDIFQSTTTDNTKTNIFAQKAAELLTNWNKGIENIKLNTKNFFAPAISFAGKIKSGYSKLNDMTLNDMFDGIKEQITMLSLDKDVRKYAKMPVADLKEELAKELAV